jgi:hypothetical protein
VAFNKAKPILLARLEWNVSVYRDSRKRGLSRCSLRGTSGRKRVVEPFAKARNY